MSSLDQKSSYWQDTSKTFSIVSRRSKIQPQKPERHPEMFNPNKLTQSEILQRNMVELYEIATNLEPGEEAYLPPFGITITKSENSSTPRSWNDFNASTIRRYDVPKAPEFEASLGEILSEAVKATATKPPVDIFTNIKPSAIMALCEGRDMDIQEAVTLLRINACLDAIGCMEDDGEISTELYQVLQLLLTKSA